jgi:exonuclease III
MPRRGVAILIKNEIDFVLIEKIVDSDENILILKCKINNYEFLLGSVYGPNKDTKEFFEDLQSYVQGANSKRVIIGGDWNLTPSAEAPPDNLDTYKMLSPPSCKRTEWFREVCEKNSLVDIFRLVHNDLVDYTYVPFGTKKKQQVTYRFFCYLRKYNSLCRQVWQQGRVL